MEELRSLIAHLVEAYVSSLPPKSAIINPNAKKVTITQPRLGLTAKKPSPPAPAKSSSPRGLSDSDLIATLDRYGIDRKNATDMLAHDTDLRRDLKLDDPKLKNTDYSRRVYAAATKRS